MIYISYVYNIHMQLEIITYFNAKERNVNYFIIFIYCFLNYLLFQMNVSCQL